LKTTRRPFVSQNKVNTLNITSHYIAMETVRPLQTAYKAAATGNRKEMNGKKASFEAIAENGESWS